VHRNTAQLESFEINLVPGTLPQCQFIVLVTKEVNRTYFSDPAWRAFVKRYAMALDEKLVLWLEEEDNAIIFDPPETGDDVSSAEELSLDGGAGQAIIVCDTPKFITNSKCPLCNPS
jgi:hypothetical protein